MSAYQSVVKSSRLQLVIAFAAVYLIWGSTYLGIRFAIETIPPFLMMGVRFLIGGLLFLTYAFIRGEVKASLRNWRTAAVIGILMLCGGTGIVGWAEMRVPSGLAALLVAGVPFWIVLVDWLRPGGIRPSLITITGLLVGFVGIGILIGPEQFAGSHRVDPIGAVAVLFAGICWGSGSIYSRHNHDKLPKSKWMSGAAELLVGGVVLVLLGRISGEGDGFTLANISTKSILALLYLAIFGSLAFAAYVWLLKASTPARAATYAYVNPLVAVILGGLLGGEEFSMRIGIASVVIIGAVVIITATKSSPSTASVAELKELQDGGEPVTSEPS